jgi:hypothetical protein
MPYKSFQFVAYHVPTDKMLPAGKDCTISKDSEDAIKDILAELSADARSRLLRMIAVAEKAEASQNWAKTTLKIFVAPEFYFRPYEQGNEKNEPPRGYVVEEMGDIIRSLSLVFGQERWKGWLFVFGTLIWKLEASRYIQALDVDPLHMPKGANNQDDPKAVAAVNEAAKDKNQANDAIKNPVPKDDQDKAADKFIYLNTAVIVEGGSKGARTFQKTNYADVADGIEKDFRPDLANPLFAGLGFKPRNLLKDYFVDLKKLNVEAAFFQQEDFWFGIEVCKDHMLAVLKNGFKGFCDNRNLDISQFKLQIVTACGMSVIPQSLFLPVGGLSLRLDGDSKSVAPRSDIQQVTSLQGIDMQSVRETKVIDNKPKVVALAGDLVLDATGIKTGNGAVDLAEAHPQEIWIYQPQDLPALEDVVIAPQVDANAAANRLNANANANT